jgi:lipoprotein-anchoring transpeptidase ErfK/SrfK
MVPTRINLGVGVLLVVLLGAGACAGGEGDGSAGNRPVASSPAPPSPEATEASPEPPPPAVSSAPPSVAPTTSPARPSPSPQGCPTGEKQREVETALDAIGGYGPVTVDGVQSETDCAAIVKFQKRFGISPPNGRAGPTTADVSRRIAASLTPAERAKCGAGGGLTACVDLSQQTMWVVRDGEVIMGPTVVRTGFSGYATPAGTFRIGYRNVKEWSKPYKVWLPYWQHFVDGIGFHETTTYLHNMGNGSHGCVNLLHSDAVELWGLLRNGTTVKTFGRRSGT